MDFDMSYKVFYSACRKKGCDQKKLIHPLMSLPSSSKVNMNLVILIIQWKWKYLFFQQRSFKNFHKTSLDRENY